MITQKMHDKHCDVISAAAEVIAELQRYPLALHDCEKLRVAALRLRFASAQLESLAAELSCERVFIKPTERGGNI